MVGTHALFQDNVQFAKLGLVIIDQQHRFGVDERLSARNEGLNGMTPHQLVMTEQPLFLQYLGDVELMAISDTSVIDELPPGRTHRFEQSLFHLTVVKKCYGRIARRLC